MAETQCAAAAAATMLRAVFGSAAHHARPGLADFQTDAVARLEAALETFGGALLCDSVGLGKTHVAGALIRDAIERERKVLVTAPAQLKGLWAHQLRGLQRWRWVSHTALSRQRAVARLSGSPFDLIVVDEAHGFRNAATRRYRALARIAVDARVLLITATPVNNSLTDFYSLVRLFAADDTFGGIGVPSLRSEIDAAMRNRSHDIGRVVQRIVVRRTREDVRAWQTSSSGAGGRAHLVFPRCNGTQLVEYDLDDVYAGSLQSICSVVLRLRFAVCARGSDGVPAELMRMSLLKRLESSTAAFQDSIARLQRLTETFRAAAAQGLFFDIARDAALATAVDGALQLTLHALALERWPAARDRHRALIDADTDLRLLNGLRIDLRTAALRGDPKAERLRELLNATAGDKVVIFTEYRTTAAALARALESCGGVACVHGGEARLGRRRTSRRVVLERFAPRAQHAPPPRKAEIVRVLITTDVLSEGVNLQDARVAVSYDLPWNPVRLAQRGGRIDRIGSPHATIEIHAFRPAREIDVLIGLLRRIRRKLRRIRTVGGDTPPPFTRGAAPPAHAAIGAAARAREQARIDFVAGAQRHGTVRRALLRWGGQHAALCCVRWGRGAALMLVDTAGHASIDGADTWNATRAALASSCSFALSVEDHAALDQLEATALRRVRTARHAGPAGSRSLDRVRLLLREWLAGRPGGPTAGDFAAADRILALMRVPARAGLELEIRALLQGRAPADAVVARLLAVASSGLKGKPLDEPPEIVASLLLVPVAPVRAAPPALPLSG